MRNIAAKAPVFSLTVALLGTVLGPLSACKTSGIADLYMSPDQDGSRNQSAYFAGQPIYCVLKMNSGRLDETLLVSYQPVQVIGTDGNVFDPHGAPQLVSNVAPGRFEGIVATLFPAPAVVARANPNAQLVMAADSTDGASQVALVNDLRAKMLAHFADGTIHREVDLSGVQPPMQDPVMSPGLVPALAAQVRSLFSAHISSTTYHYFSDDRDTLVYPLADPSAPPAQFTQALNAELNELKIKMNNHVATVVEKPLQAPGRYRCDIVLADEHQTVDFVIMPGGDRQPDPQSQIPRPGQCDGDPVARCPDPKLGPDTLRCCTATGACGVGPKGTPFCY